MEGPSSSSSTVVVSSILLPTELIRIIFEIAAQTHRPTGHALLLVSHSVRRWVHSIVYATVEIFGFRRMVAFWQVFSREEEVFTTRRSSSSSPSGTSMCQWAGAVVEGEGEEEEEEEETRDGGDRLLASSVRELSVCDDRRGDSTMVDCEERIVEDILRMCTGVKRLALNYTCNIKTVMDGPKPFELILRRGLHGVNLGLPPFDNVTRLHCRFEQLMPYALPKLATYRLTHVCFTHHVDIASQVCIEVVKHFLAQPQLELLIVEVTYHTWHRRADPEIRRKLAQLEVCGGMERKLFVRLSRYETVFPYDEERFFTEDQEDVWAVEKDVDWRKTVWDEEMIMRNGHSTNRILV